MKNNKLYKIGITGGICSGKSTLIKYLDTVPGAKILNLDNFTPTIYHRNFILLNKIKKNFGNDVFTQNEELNRKLLGKIVFRPENKHLLHYLNRLMIPEYDRFLPIYISSFEKEFALSKNKFTLFIEGATIIEAGLGNYFDELWVVKASQEEVLRRFKKRISDENIVEYNESMLLDIQKTQLSVEERVKFAKKVIDTSGSVEETQRYVKLLLSELKII